MHNKNTIFYKPQEGFVADIIPFYDGGEFKLFYLHDFRNRDKHGEGTPWYLISTKDLIRYTEHGEVIPRGTVDEQDLYIFTGSVIKDASNLYHIFYTGHNPHFLENGKKVQAIMHATSADLIKWQKIPEDTFYSNSDLFEYHDWRDPFVFKNNGNYKMAITARTKNGNKVRAGVTILYESNDLKTWTYEKTLWMPDAYYAHECPDIFKVGEKWYLIYSEFTDQTLTRYVMADTLEGPWVAPERDSFDGRAYYAAKTTTDHLGNRYIFGWNPTKDQNDDKGKWHWGGNLTAHQITVNADGTLAVRIPASIEQVFNHIEKIADQAVTSQSGVKTIQLVEQTEDSYMLTFDIETEQVYQLGIMLRQDSSNDFAYAYFMDYSKNKLFFDNMPVEAWNFNNFRNVFRNYEFKDQAKHTVKMIVENGICICYIDDQIALSSRMYQKGGNGLALFVKHGHVKFSNIEYKTIKK